MFGRVGVSVMTQKACCRVLPGGFKVYQRWTRRIVMPNGKLQFKVRIEGKEAGVVAAITTPGSIANGLPGVNSKSLILRGSHVKR
jgi:hypothetical protein